ADLSAKVSRTVRVPGGARAISSRRLPATLDSTTVSTDPIIPVTGGTHCAACPSWWGIGTVAYRSRNARGDGRGTVSVQYHPVVVVAVHAFHVVPPNAPSPASTQPLPATLPAPRAIATCAGVSS